MKKTFKISAKLFLITCLVAIAYLNYSLYYTPNFKSINKEAYNEGVYHQLLFLKKELHNGAGDEMQKIFPEGFVFINSLYGLSWSNLIEKIDPSSTIYKEGIKEIDWAFNEINSPQAKRIFHKNLPLEYGVFYRGWSNYLLGSKLMIQANEERDSSDIYLYKNNCGQIAALMSQQENPYLESYRGQAWPADMVVAVASVGLHDKIYKALYQDVITAWILKVKDKLDTETGLIPHSVNAKSGDYIEGARGSSQSLTLSFLKNIDEQFSQAQFDIYKSYFLDSRFGLPGVREYPKGKNGNGDIDSGPVIFGIGGAASIVGQRAMAEHKNWETYEGLRNSIESFGVGCTIGGEKNYIFGQLPIADAFIAWSNAIEQEKYFTKTESNWRIKFQMLSFFIITVIAFLLKK